MEQVHTVCVRAACSLCRHARGPARTRACVGPAAPAAVSGRQRLRPGGVVWGESVCLCVWKGGSVRALRIRLIAEVGERSQPCLA